MRKSFMTFAWIVDRDSKFESCHFVNTSLAHDAKGRAGAELEAFFDIFGSDLTDVRQAASTEMPKSGVGGV